MAAVIDLTEISSDDEDVSEKPSVSQPRAAAAAAAGNAKNRASGEAAAAATIGGKDGSSGGFKGVGGHAVRSPRSSLKTSSSSSSQGTEKTQQQSRFRNLVETAAGMTKKKSADLSSRRGKNAEPSILEEASFAPRLSTWGEPLSPEPDSRSVPKHNNNHNGVREEGGISRSNGGVNGQQVNYNGNGSNDVQKRVRGTSGGKWKASQPNSPSTTAAGPSSPPPPDEGPAGVCRHFWRAGDYEAQPARVKAVQGAMDHVRVHPKFLHSNATSHKWALGALAELLDNAVDEVQNGATFVRIEKMVNPRDGNPALLIQDDGGGMSPESIRQCMSLGYSRKNSNTTIGQYGNGFKTSTMRLGADVIVFSRSTRELGVSQSVGLLSYTFLRKTGHEEVVVPMIDYEVSTERDGPLESPRKLVRSTVDDWYSNLTSITQWSPYGSESELLAQFEDLGGHGTKVLVYNLWFNDDGVLELDFDSDEQDIQLRGGAKLDKGKPVQQQLAQQHIANRYQHSLRVYASILYLQMPRGFQIILRGKPVEHHSIASDLKYPEQINYKPQIGNTRDANKETSVITVIGFTKEAPLINVHGFNVYHKNRLIMPFWKVWQDNSSRGRGVVGVLEANFVEPAHDKQDFERTAVLLRLETRLKQMTLEYWNLHCHFIGYHPNTKAGKARKQAAAGLEYPAPIASISPAEVHAKSLGGPSVPVEDPRISDLIPPSRNRSSASRAETGGPQVKTESVVDSGPDSSKRPKSGSAASDVVQTFKRQRMAGGATDVALAGEQSEDDAMMIELIEENLQLRTRCVECEHEISRLGAMVSSLEKELLEANTRNANLRSMGQDGDRLQNMQDGIPNPIQSQTLQRNARVISEKKTPLHVAMPPSSERVANSMPVASVVKVE